VAQHRHAPHENSEQEDSYAGKWERACGVKYKPHKRQRACRSREPRVSCAQQEPDEACKAAAPLLPVAIRGQLMSRLLDGSRNRGHVELRNLHLKGERARRYIDLDPAHAV